MCMPSTRSYTCWPELAVLQRGVKVLYNVPSFPVFTVLLWEDRLQCLIPMATVPIPFMRLKHPCFWWIYARVQVGLVVISQYTWRTILQIHHVNIDYQVRVQTALVAFFFFLSEITWMHVWVQIPLLTVCAGSNPTTDCSFSFFFLWEWLFFFSINETVCGGSNSTSILLSSQECWLMYIYVCTHFSKKISILSNIGI